MNKLKKNCYDDELLKILKVPTRKGNVVQYDFYKWPDGTLKRDKNGRPIIKRPYKPRPKKDNPNKDELD